MRRLAQGVLLMAALVAVTAGPAGADPEIGLSRDGTSWASSLGAPLFDSGIRWVPGDSRVASFFVRNESADPAELSVDVLGSRIDSLLDTGDVTISAQGGSGGWREISTAGTHQLVSDVAARSGAAARVSVKVDFDPASTNMSMRRDLDLRFRVRLIQAAVAVDDDNGLLPGTGAPALWPAFIGLALLAGGLSLTSRRRERNHHVQS